MKLHLSFDYNLGQRLRSILSITLLMMFSSVSYALTVTVSIPPLAGLIQPLLAKEDKVEVLLKRGISPHGFRLKPSQLRVLAKSDLVLWNGTAIDSWLEKPLLNITKPQLVFADVKGLTTLPVRSGGLWEQHNHAGHSEHGHEGHAEHGHDESGHNDKHDNHYDNSEHNHDDHHKHAVDSHVLNIDGHLWLSIDNAQAFVKAVSIKLQQLDKNRAEQIKIATEQWLTELQQIDKKVEQQLYSVRNQPYLVLHDAFQYFEKRYQLNGIGAIQINPQVAPSLRRIHELRQKIADGGAVCIFKEPQFPERRIAAVTRKLAVNIGELDPIGLNNSNGVINYGLFYQQLAQQFYSCLHKSL